MHDEGVLTSLSPSESFKYIGFKIKYFISNIIKDIQNNIFLIFKKVS